MIGGVCWLNKKLIRRWDSDRELFYNDIVHVEASAYAHWTDFLISSKHLLYLPAQPIKPSFNVNSPVQPTVLHSGPAHCYKKLITRHGRRQLQSEVEAIRPTSSCFAKIITEQSCRSRHRISKVDFDPEVGLIIVLRRHRTRKFGDIMQNKGHCAVQGHSRSPILVPIESSCTMSY